MGSHNLIVTNLQPSDPTDFRALDLYRLLYDFSRLPTSFYRPPNYNKPIQTLHNLVNGGCRLTSSPLAAIKDANVFVFTPTSELMNIGKTNRVVFFVPGELTDNLLPLLPIADVIATYSIYEATVISRQLRRLGYSTPVAKVTPPFDLRHHKSVIPSTFKLGFQPSIDYQILAALEPAKAEIIPNFTGASAYYHLQTSVWPYDVLESMINGKPVITPKRPPLFEYIINGFNGYLIRERHEAIEAIQNLQTNSTDLGQNAKRMMTGLLDPAIYVPEIINLTSDRFYNLNAMYIPEHVVHDKRKWLFRKEMLNQGKVQYLPEKHDPSFKLSNLDGIAEIISFLSQQQFQCAYVFNFELGDLTILEMNNIAMTAERLGRRGLTIHFCTDEPIPDRWRDVFKNLSIISVAEATKQVS